MAVRRFRENKWIADVFRDGQRFRKVFDTKRHALAWDGKIKTAALEGKLFDVRQDTFATFAEMMDWFLALPEVQRKRSYDKDVGRSKHLKVFLGELSPSKIIPEKIQEYIHQRLTAKNRKGTGSKPATVNRDMALLKTCFNRAFRNGKCYKNPATSIRKLKGEVQRDRVLTDEEWEAYYREASPRFKPIALCAYVAAMRQGEILNLRWDRVDRKGGFIRLQPEDTKTSEGRSIPIDPRLDAVLESLPRSIQKDGHVFTKNGLPVRKDKAGDEHERTCKNVVIENFWFHDFRHTCTTNWRRKGIDYLTIMKATGHKTLAMFQRYNSVTEGDLKALVRPVLNPDCHHIVTKA